MLKIEPSEELEFVYDLLRKMKERDASDLFLTANAIPSFKIDGEITPIEGCEVLTKERVEELVLATMNEKNKNEFLSTFECNYALSLSKVGRYRVNAFKQRGSSGLVIRIINTIIPTLEDLQVPGDLKKLVGEKKGLIIVVGATGSGKSTTLAAMIGHRNETQAGHIITIEDPIEFIHKHKKSIITQREVGSDTESWEKALKNTLRQAPDVILIGEVRDKETMEHAISFSETGHLCLCTLHANNANQALDRIINFFPEDRRNQLLMDLSLNLKGIISQRLIPSTDSGRVPAVEILLNSARVSELILEGKVNEIKDVMKMSEQMGMKTFDRALLELYKNKKIDYDNALRYADNANDLMLEIRLQTHTDTNKKIEYVINNL